MQEILPGVLHWTAFRDTIGMRVSSLERDFDDLLFAHGDPIVGDGKRALRNLATSAAGEEHLGQAL